jgi:hypothetical protein
MLPDALGAQSGANGASSCMIVVGRVCIDYLSLSGLVTSIPYPFRLQMAKVQKKLSENPHERATRLTIRRVIAT